MDETNRIKHYLSCDGFIIIFLRLFSIKKHY